MKKYQLMVSHDCGTNYHSEATADNVMAFAERCKELDHLMLRWIIADKDEKPISEPEYTCRMFREIFSSIDMARVRERRDAMKPFYEEKRAKGGPP